MLRVKRTEEVHAEFWWGNLKEGDHLEQSGVVGRIMLKFVFKKWNVEA
jgi:hypothetical protein